MISRNYEVLIVDPSPGALVAGAALAREGLSVLVLDRKAGPSMFGNFRFLQHHPPITGFQHGLLLPRSLKTLRFHPHELQSVRRGEPGLQIINSRHRFELHPDPGQLMAELQREFPRDAAALRSLVDQTLASAGSFAAALEDAVEEAGQIGFFQSVGLARPSWTPPLPPEDVPSWGSFLDRFDISDEVRTVLRGILRPFCCLDVVEDLPLPVAGIHFADAIDGAFADPGEEHTLLALLLRRVRAMRVSVLDQEPEAFLGSRRKVEAVSFAGRADPMPVDYVITGGDPEDLLPWLPGNLRSYDRVLSRLAPSHFRYSIYLGVEESVLPPDLADHALLLDDEDPEAPGGCVLMSTSPQASAMAPAGFRAITLSTLLPYSDEGSPPNDLEPIASRMLDRLKWLIPYLERHLEVLQIPSQLEVDDDHPIAIDPSPAAYTPAIPPGEDPVAAGVGVFLPHRNVFCAGPAAFPALGLGGEALAGRLVERLSLAGRKKAPA